MMSKRNRKGFAAEELLNEMETDQVIDDVSAITGASKDDASTLEKVAEVNEKADAAKAEAEETAGAADDAKGSADSTEGAEGSTEASDTPAEDGEAKTEEGAVADSEETPLSEEEQATVTAAVEELMENADSSAVVTEEDASVIENGLLDREDTVIEAIATANTLEDIACALDETVSVGGIKPVEAPSVRAAVGVVFDTAGTDLSPEFLATESLTPSKRLNSTKMAIESIKEQATKIWDAIVKFLSNLVKWVTDHVKAFFDSAKANELKLESLKKTLSTFKGAEKEDYFTSEETPTHKAVADKFIIHTKAGGAEANFKTSNDSFISAATMFGASVKHAHDSISKIVTKVMEVNLDIGGLTNTLSAHSILGNGWKSTSDIPGYETVPDMECFVGDLLPGGVRLGAYLPKSNLDIKDSIKAMRDAKIVFAKQRLEADYKLKYLQTKQEIEEAIAGLLAVNKLFVESNKRLVEFTEVKKSLIKRLGNKYSTAAANMDKKEVTNNDSQELASYLILSLSKLYDSPTSTFSKLYITYLNAGTEFVRMSIKRGM